MQVLNKKSKKLTIKIALVLSTLLLILGAYTLYAHNNNAWPFSAEISNKDPDQESTGINYDPPTDQEVKDGQEAKKRTENSQDDSLDTNSTDKQPSANVSNKRRVSVGVSFADIIDSNLEVRAFTNGAIQGGACTVTAVNGNERITKESRAFIDASSTVCEPIYIPESQLHPGVWMVSVEFESADAIGKSEIIEVSL